MYDNSNSQRDDDMIRALLFTHFYIHLRGATYYTGMF